MSASKKWSYERDLFFFTGPRISSVEDVGGAFRFVERMVSSSEPAFFRKSEVVPQF